jgi:hypothetical protein
VTPDGSHVSGHFVPGGNIFSLYHLGPGGKNVLLIHLVPGGKMVPEGLIFFFGPFAQRGSFAHKLLFDIKIKFCTFKS